MDKRFVQEDSMVRDTSNGMLYDLYWVVDLLNLWDRKIKDLEEQLGD